MNRREFTRGLAALGVAPALPLPNLAKAAPAAAATVAVNSAVVESMYFWGWFVARSHKICSPEILAKMLKMDAAVADEVYARLLGNGVITAPNAAGISRAVDPLNDAFTTMKKTVSKRIAETAETGNSAKSRIKLAGDEDAGLEQEAAPDQDAHASDTDNDAPAPLPSINHEARGLEHERDDPTDSPDPDSHLPQRGD